jgi:short-chain Z-isoprenyl diphosphate synthase
MHVGLIPDGNRRWCRRNGVPYTHLIDTLVARLASDEFHNAMSVAPMCQITAFSMYLLSLDNLTKRQDDTLRMVTHALERVADELERLHDPLSLRVQFVGELDMLPDDMRRLTDRIEALCSDPRARVRVYGAIAYDPVADAGRVASGGGRERPSQPPIDLVVRTGGEMRSSGFFPMHTLYSEWFYEPELFPDFDLADLERIVGAFEGRARRFGA